MSAVGPKTLRSSRLTTLAEPNACRLLHSAIDGAFAFISSADAVLRIDKLHTVHVIQRQIGLCSEHCHWCG